MVPPPKHNERGALAKVWREFNKLRDVVMASRPIAGQRIHIDRTTHGSIIRGDVIKVEPAVSGVVNQYLVKEVDGDYLRCRIIDGTAADADDVYIAKPFDLRRTPWDAQTVTMTIYYSAADGTFKSTTVDITYTYYNDFGRKAEYASYSESQVIVPYYIPDRSVIYAIDVEEEINITSDHEILKIDLNTDGRAWCKAF